MKYLLLLSFWLISLTVTVSAQVDELQCPGVTGDFVLYACNGELGIKFNYTTPYFGSTAAIDVKITRIEGLASGSIFPVGTTRVTHVAEWTCQPVPPTQKCYDTCTFTVTVERRPFAKYYRDYDRDGWGDTNNPDSIFDCADVYIDQYSQLPGDCDDSNPLVYRSSGLRYVDHDGDGYVSRVALGSICWGDTWPEGEPQPGVDPGIVSTILNGYDCDDNDKTITDQKYFYLDADNDGYPAEHIIRDGIDLGNKILACSNRAAAGGVFDPRYKLESELNHLEFDCDDNDPEKNNGSWYFDADNDGYSNSLFIGQSCSSPGPQYKSSTKGWDCDDTDSAINAGTIWWLDADNDGYSDGTSLVQCERPLHYKLARELTAISGDCNDGDPTIPTIWVLDADKDGYYTGDPIPRCGASPGQGYELKIAQKPGDCNDDDPAINPLTVWYLDFDGDGYHNPTTIGLPSCTQPGPYYKLTTKGPDCNDDDPAVHVPVQYYIDSDKDGYGSVATAMLCFSVAPVGYSTNNTDCNDNNNAIHPGATEVCDGIDNDCDGLVDEGVKSTFFRDADGDGYGNPSVSTQACSAPAGYVSNNTDCNDNIIAIHPGATEVCDGIDNDCDGLVDEGVKSTFYRDADGDGYGNPLVTTQACSAPAGYVSNNTDCSDNDPGINPAAVEVCGNKKDDNCNGVVDENVCYACLNATNLRATSITSNSAQISWNATANPVQWQLQYKTTNKGSKWVDILLTGNLRTYKLTPLSSNQNYQVQIRAKCSNTWTSYSAAQSFKTLSVNTASVASAQPLPEEISGSSPGLKLYPNPNNGQFVIQLTVSNEPDGNAKIEMVDVLGRIVHTEHANLSSGKLQKTVTMPSQVTRGVYMLRIIVNDKAYQTKLIYQ